MKDPSSELEHLAQGIRQCTKCRLHQNRKNAVPGEGPPDAKIAFIGEAPGSVEDKYGRPFMGLSGKFFDKLLQENGISRNQVFITSCVKCHPSKNRKPRQDELNTCITTWLEPQLACLTPRMIVLLGGVATRQILDSRRPVSELHGTTYEKNGRTFFVTYHPAAGMRFPLIASSMRKDFAVIARFYDGMEK